jgi:hypothetical protein
MRTADTEALLPIQAFPPHKSVADNSTTERHLAPPSAVTESSLNKRLLLRCLVQLVPNGCELRKDELTP